MRSGRPYGAGSRKGALLSVELLFVLPILLGLILAMVEFSLLFSARQQVKTASQLACRVGTMPGSDPVQIERAVRQAAAKGLIRCSLVKSYELKFEPGRNTGDPVVVDVRVPMRAAAPNLLAMIGYDLNGRHLRSRTVMRKE